MSDAAAPRDSIDVASLLDAGAWSPLQRTIVGLAALAVLLDGFDSQLIGYAIPSLMKEWGLTLRQPLG